MARDPREWSVPASARALLWWPPTSFVLVVVAPDEGVGSIMIAGGVLALVGVLVSAVAPRVRREAETSSAEDRRGELATIEVPPVEATRERAA
jgi:hypothetical protein